MLRQTVVYRKWSLFSVLILLNASFASAGVYGHWPLNDGAGDSAVDLGPRGADAAIFDAEVAGLGENGSVWYNDPIRGTVLGLDGSSGWVDAGELPIMDYDNEFTWSFWARQSANQVVNNDVILGNRYNIDGVDTVPRDFIKFTPSNFEYHMNGAPNGNIAYSSFGGAAGEGIDIPSNDEWIHHAVVKEGDQLVYYRNGEAANGRSFSIPMGSPDPLPFAMGGQNALETWRGYLSDVQLYESALDATAISSAMNGQVAAGAELYARWKLDDGDGDSAADLGPNGLDGIIFDWDIDGLSEDGTVWVDDPERGTVLGLGGETAWVDAGEIPVMDLDNDFTWTFWARQDPDQVSPANDIVIGNRYGFDGADTSPREFIKFTPDRFEFHTEAAGNGDLQYTDAGFGPWVHHLVVKDGDSLAYYRNGELDGEAAITEEQLSPDPLPFVMGGHAGGVETWSGLLSDVQLFDHAVSESEIAELSGSTGTVVGDFDGNGVLDLNDINQLTVESASGANNDAFDVTNDGLVDSADVSTWAIELKNTWIGDANLDGVFDTTDFVSAFQEGKFENGEAANWSQGDWNGDGLFNSSDFVAAFTDGGFEQGARTAVAAVPEPQGLFGILLAIVALIHLGSRRRK